MSTAIAVVPFNEMERLAIAVAKSELFDITKPEEALSLMAIAQAEGQHPAIAARDYHIIKGKPTLKADAMLARFLGNGGKVEWHSYTDDKTDATFSHPYGGTVRIEWDMARAKKAELGGNGMWKKYPRQMLRSRTISEGIRTVYPGIAIGMYTPEEVEDFDDRPQRHQSAPIPLQSSSVTEKKPEAPKVEAPVDPETGEVGPHTVSIPVLSDNSGSDWMKYGTLYAAAIKSASTGAELEAWVKANSVGMGSIATAAPKLHARLLSVIGEKRTLFAETSATDDPLAIPDFLKRQGRLAEAAE